MNRMVVAIRNNCLVQDTTVKCNKFALLNCNFFFAMRKVGFFIVFQKDKTDLLVKNRPAISNKHITMGLGCTDDGGDVDFSTFIVVRISITKSANGFKVSSTHLVRAHAGGKTQSLDHTVANHFVQVNLRSVFRSMRTNIGDLMLQKGCHRALEEGVTFIGAQKVPNDTDIDFSLH